MVWWVKILIVLGISLVINFINFVLHHRWAWAEVCWWVLSFIWIVQIWIVFNFWLAALFFIFQGQYMSYVEEWFDNRSQKIIVSYDFPGLPSYHPDNSANYVYINCRRCGYNEVIVKKEEEDSPRGRVYVYTHCPRCGKDDVIEGNL